MWCDTEAPSTDLSECDARMADQGAQRVRTLVQLRRSLPSMTTHAGGIPEVQVRTFDPGHDVQGLLATNNAAFDWHPEQGRWDTERLERALAQHWVDPAGILVHDSEDPALGDGHIDGFCWTRVHPADEPDIAAAGDPALGEIWVIATDPAVHGTRLGPAMVVAGLDHLAERGLRVANLFTEEDNRAALSMYARLGFTVHQRRGGYR
ncbi:MAG: GNAT family N-acetyltransferase [Microthrixaceae bacterium]|nr:GNAT family N-acetyltransferase [Microthrixaceae bacterium]